MEENNVSNSNSENSQVPPIVAAEYLENNVVSYNLKKKFVNFYMLIIHDIIKFLPVYAWNFYCIF